MRKSSLLILILFGLLSCQEENQLPNCTITNPANGDTIMQGDLVDITVTADDADGTVKSVRYYIDDAGIADVVSAPYGYLWSTGNTGPGEHTIKAEVIDDHGGKGSDIISIIIVNVDPPEAEFTVNSTAPVAGEEVLFTDLSGGDPDMWLWDFGDGETDTTQHPGHNYELAGQYSVSLTVYNQAGADSIIKENYIQVSEPLSESEILLEYLESEAGGNYVNTLMPAIRTAEHIKTLSTVATNYIIDIRSPDDFAAGHIENAVNVAVPDILTHLEGTTEDDGKEEINIVGYTGQTSAWVTCLLRLSGYDNVYSMKWGMCSWNVEFASKWNSNISSMYSSQFTTEEADKGPEGELPVLSTGYSTGEEILHARIEEVLAAGFGAAKTTGSMVFEALEDYYIVNYWPEADYIEIGHIQGAIQYTPKESISLDADLLTLPVDKEIVIYDWTGQVSAGLAAYLRVIGYDAKTLVFGVNGMIYDDLESHKWSVEAIMDYEYVAE